MKNSIVGLTFFCFKPQILFLVNLVQKVQNVSWSWNLITKLIRICRIQWCVHFFWFRLRKTFLSKFDPKTSNCLFKVKYGTKPSSNTPNLMVMFIFSCVLLEIPFWINLILKIKVVSLSWNLVPEIIQLLNFFFLIN